MLTFYQSVIDASVHSLKGLPAAHRLMMMMAALGLMETRIVYTGAAAWMWLCPLIMLHLLAGGFTIAGVSFTQARLVKTSRDDPAKAGAPRYGDVWGA
jgi:hypothetical protein